jgi:hypothetical protein
VDCSLTKEKIKEWCYLSLASDFKVKIDKEDVDRVNAHKWRITKGTTGRLRVVTTIRTPKGARHLTLGRFLMAPPEGMQVYPRRFNEGLDYRKSNLIVCTMKERQRLLPKTRMVTTSSYRGVSFSKTYSKWKAAIKCNGRNINIGIFDSEEDAALAYNKAATQYFGDIAYQNKINKPKKDRKD